MSSLGVLPVELIWDILSFLRSPTSCLVCRRWCRAAHLKHVSGYNLPSHVDLTAFIDHGVISARFLMCFRGEELAPSMALPLSFFCHQLAQSTSLTSLYLALSRVELVDQEGTRHLAKLKDCQNLSTLTLDLAYVHLTSHEVIPLAELRTAPHLTSLSLKLFNNCIGDQGCRALARLHESTSLVKLDLDLRRNGITGLGLSHFRAFALGPPSTSASPLSRPALPLRELSLNVLFNVTQSNCEEVVEQLNATIPKCVIQWEPFDADFTLDEDETGDSDDPTSHWSTTEAESSS